MSSHKATESFCFVHTTQYIYEEDNKSALERLGRQATFKFRALWSVRDGKGLMNITNNQEILETISSIHNIKTRNKHHLHRPNANQSCFQKSTFYTSIKIFNSLPPSTKIFKNDMAKFKATLRKYLHTLSLYSVDEFFKYKDDLTLCRP